MRAYTAHYTLRNGHRGSLPVFAPCSIDAAIQVIDYFKQRLAKVAVRAGL